MRFRECLERLKRVPRRLRFAALLLAIAAFVPRGYSFYDGRGRREETVEKLTPASGRTVGIVFGAALWGGKPSPILGDRIRAAVELYQQHKVDKLLLSGDNRFGNYNEPEAMREAILALGVPPRDIAVDYAGRRTYDSCYRARTVFLVDEAVLVTQDFHLDRALLLCNGVGMRARGLAVSTARYGPQDRLKWTVREWAATFVALLDLTRRRSPPVLGSTIDIFDPCAVHRSLSNPGAPPDGC